MTKHCLACKTKLNGRTDKKFCNPACKNDYHNSMKVRIGSRESKLLEASRKNRSILEKLVRGEIAEYKPSELENLGFSMNGVTGVKAIPSVGFILYCYDYQILWKSDRLLIARNLG